MEVTSGHLQADSCSACSTGFEYRHRIEGTIYSPRQPDGSAEYPAYLTCSWTIHAQVGVQKIQLQFESFDLEHDKDCQFDYLEVTDGTQVTTFCGNKKPGNYTSTTHKLELKFKSDRKVSGTGFKILWKLKGTASAVCRNLKLEETANYGRIQSSNYPHPYDHNQQCEWRITPDVNQFVQIRFVHFALGDAGDCKSGMIDYVEIIVNHMVQGRYCNDSTPFNRNIHKASTWISIVFYSNANGNAKGFDVEWRLKGKYADACDAGGKELNQSYGVIQSPNYPLSYGKNVECRWDVITSLDTVPWFEFTSFITQESPHCKYDWLEYYESLSDTQPAMEFCSEGNPPPNELFGANNKVKLVFKSDRAVGAAGFQITWTSARKDELLCLDKTKNNCHANATCYPLSQTMHNCTCNTGFVGDGTSCTAYQPTTPKQQLPATTPKPVTTFTSTSYINLQPSSTLTNSTSMSSNFSNGSVAASQHRHQDDSVWTKSSIATTVCTVIIYISYIALVMWSYFTKTKKKLWSGRTSVVKDKFHSPEDLKPNQHYHYVVTVYIGDEPGAGTKNTVRIKLIGSAAESFRSSLQTSDGIHVFKRDSVNSFLLGTYISLGDIKHVQFMREEMKEEKWTIKRMSVRDMKKNECWFFRGEISFSGLRTKLRLPAMNRTAINQGLFRSRWENFFKDRHLLFAITPLTNWHHGAMNRVERISVFYLTVFMIMVTSLSFSIHATARSNLSSAGRTILIGLGSPFVVAPMVHCISEMFRMTPRMASSIDTSNESSKAQQPTMQNKSGRASRKVAATSSEKSVRGEGKTSKKSKSKSSTHSRKSKSKTSMDNAPPKIPRMYPSSGHSEKEADLPPNQPSDAEPSPQSIASKATAEKSADLEANRTKKQPSATNESKSRKSNTSKATNQKSTDAKASKNGKRPSDIRKSTGRKSKVSKAKNQEQVKESMISKASKGISFGWNRLLQMKAGTNATNAAGINGTNDASANAADALNAENAAYDPNSRKFRPLPTWYRPITWFILLFVELVSTVICLYYSICSCEEGVCMCATLEWWLSVVIGVIVSVFVVDPIRILILTVISIHKHPSMEIGEWIPPLTSEVLPTDVAGKMPMNSKIQKKDEEMPKNSKIQKKDEEIPKEQKLTKTPC